MPAMDDFMANIDRRPILLQREIDDIDRAVDSGAKTSWIGKIDFHDCHLSLTQDRGTSVPGPHIPLVPTLRQSNRPRQLNWPTPLFPARLDTVLSPS